MPLAEILQAFLDEMKWEDEIQEHDGDHYIDTEYRIDTLQCHLQFITNESDQLLRVFLRSPIAAPEERRVSAAVIVGTLNLRLQLGALYVDEDGSIYFSWAIDVQDASPSVTQFKKMLFAAVVAFDKPRMTALGAAAFTQVSTKRILEEYSAAVVELNASQETL